MRPLLLLVYLPAMLATALAMVQPSGLMAGVAGLVWMWSIVLGRLRALQPAPRGVACPGCGRTMGTLPDGSCAACAHPAPQRRAPGMTAKGS